MDSGAVTQTELMARAAAGAVAAILARWPELASGSRRATVVCGPGNNGADGFVVARLLRARGWEVRVFAVEGSSAARAEWIAAGGTVRNVTDPGDAVGTEPADLVVDALFGTGLARPLGRLHEAVREAFDAGRHPHRRRVALDIPSGLCADSGRVLGGGDAALAVDLTVAFHAAKPGHYLAEGPRLCGELAVADIGLPADTEGADGWTTLVGAPGAWVGKAGGHKYDHGHALVLAGGVGRGGAARLAARAALRLGAGLVTLLPPPAALIENAARLDAVMLRAVRDGDALRALLDDGRTTALCLGPGLGLSEREAGLVAAALEARRPTVLDADALTLVARDEELRGKLHAGCLLTPHDGEFARLVPDLADRLDAPPDRGPAVSRLDVARAAARRLGCTVLLKGPDTVIAEPSGRTRIHSAAYGRAAPWLATAGAGDVLAGMAAGLLARGASPGDAAAAASWLHVEAARAFGPGLTADDLPELIPAALRAAGA